MGWSHAPFSLGGKALLKIYVYEILMVYGLRWAWKTSMGVCSTGFRSKDTAIRDASHRYRNREFEIVDGYPEDAQEASGPSKIAPVQSDTVRTVSSAPGASDAVATVSVLLEVPRSLLDTLSLSLAIAQNSTEIVVNELSGRDLSDEERSWLVARYEERLNAIEALNSLVAKVGPD